MSSEESKPDDQEMLHTCQTNKELEGCINQFDVNAVKEEIISLNDEVQIDKVKFLMKNQRVLQFKLDKDLRVKFAEKKGQLEKELTQTRINLHYQIEKNLRLEFRNELRERVVMKFEQIQKDFNELKKQHVTMVVERQKSVGSDDSNGCERHEQKSNCDIVSI